MDTMRSSVIVEYNGVEASDVFTSDCNSFTWCDNANGKSDTATFDLRNPDLKWLKGFYPEETDTFKAWIKTEEWAANEKAGKLYCGKFAVDEIVFRGFPERLQLSGISVPIKNNFNVRQKNRSWSKTTVKTILSDIANEAEIKLMYEADDINVDSVNQSGKTDLSFAYSICSDYDLAIKIYNDKMIVYDQTVYEKADAKYTIHRKDIELYGIARQNTEIYDGVKIQYTNSKGNSLSYEFTVPGTAGKRQMFISTQADSLADAEKKAKAALRKNRRECKVITITLLGGTKYLAAECFELSDFGMLDGKYFIDSVTHQRTDGKYTTSIKAHGTVTEF